MRRSQKRTAARRKSLGSKCSRARRPRKIDNWLPEETSRPFGQYLVGIKGPLTTPVGGGIRSLNVALRQMLDLYVCLRPVRYFTGVPSPVKPPEKVDMVIFRENTEDIYAGIEYEAEPDRHKILEFLQEETPRSTKIRFPRPAASASSRSPKRAPSAWCARRSSTRSRRSARA